MTYVLVENPDGSGRRLELQRSLDVDGGYVIHLVEATAPDVVRRGMDAILI